jgi:hypothetical protein
MSVQITSFTALWKVTETHLSFQHMKIGLGMEVDAGKHHLSIFHILINKRDALITTKLIMKHTSY